MPTKATEKWKPTGGQQRAMTCYSSRPLFVLDRQPFVGQFDGFDRDFVAGRLELRPLDLDREGRQDLPGHHRFMILVEQADGQVAALDLVHLDCRQPVEEVVVGLDNAALQRDVAVLAQAGHLDRRIFRETAVAVFDGLDFLGQAGDFRKADAGAAPLDTEVEDRQRVLGLCGHVGCPFASGFESAGLQLVGELEDDEFSRSHDGHADLDIHPPFQDVLRAHRHAQAATHEEGFLRGCPGQCAFAPFLRQVVPHVLCVDTCLLYTSPSPRDQA
eukprot:TRINITY_DN2978_c0_g1_i1.p3 TRINITY_DN2978_c0_g1~~TRINITY_DN2978_c0_g1_i1.p3  ORF type:complete len:273 (+),score=21.90 TRINITY_DN2978_c0_g1_i1:914-1732(+)